MVTAALRSSSTSVIKGVTGVKGQTFTLVLFDWRLLVLFLIYFLVQFLLILQNRKVCFPLKCHCFGDSLFAF